MGQIRASAIEACGGEIVGVYDDYNKSDKYKNYERVDSLFEDNNIDAICICTPKLSKC